MPLTRRGLLSLVASCLVAAPMLLGGCSANRKTVDTYLDSADPVQVKMWTYYNGAQLDAFNALVDEYNNARGKEVGVAVVSESRGSVSDLSKAVLDAAEGGVGSYNMPDAFLAYADVASKMDAEGSLVNLGDYLSEEQKSRFVQSFLDEGDLAQDGSLKLYPICKSTECLSLNRTEWDEFAAATGASLDELATMEGITSVAQRYYEWTDAQTPAVPGDGRAFFGRDSMANYMLSGSLQLGHEISAVEGGAVKIDLDKGVMRKLWDNYYVPMLHGWFSAEGRFRSDAVKTGDLVAYVGATSSIAYFPSEVTVDDTTSHPIEMTVLANPHFEDGSPVAIQQGAGFAVVKSDKKREAACVDFLNWLTDTQRNASFAVSAFYVPVVKDALSEDVLAQAATGAGHADSAYVKALPATIETVKSPLYSMRPFDGSSEVRNILDTSMQDLAKKDRAAVQASLAAGMAEKDATAPYLTDAYFDAWYQGLCDQISAKVGS